MTSATRSSRTVIADRYELLRQIGQGAIGIVFEARDRRSGEPCAVKLLSASRVHRDEEAVRRFLREARACSAIDSEHVVQVFDSGIDEASGDPFMVMELLSGFDLEKLLKERAPLEPSVAVRLVVQAATGVAKAHRNGILHRDLKPANLFLSVAASGRVTVKVLDFGIAKVRGESSLTTSGTLTRTGRMIGTPLYMSPEQIRGSGEVDARTDVWSLGIVLYEALTGAPPFARQTSLGELMVSILTAELPLLQSAAPWVQPKFADVAHRAMSRSLPLRYEDAEALRAALAALVPEGRTLEERELRCIDARRRAEVAPRFALGSTEIEHMTQAPPEAVTASPRRRREWPVIGVAAAFGVVAALAFMGSDAVREPPRVRVQHAAPALSPPAAVEVGPAETRSVLVRVPNEASVLVDGVRVPVNDGQIALHGAIGDTFSVRMTHRTASLETRVAIAAQGAVPEALVFPPKAGSRVRVGNPGSTAAPSTASPSPPRDAEIELTESMEEFQGVPDPERAKP